VETVPQKETSLVGGLLGIRSFKIMYAYVLRAVELLSKLW
jgi:hypothetical protein